MHILFLVAVLYQTSFSQLLRVPMLVVHYIEHRDLNNTITFIDFLSMHYGGEDMNDDDDDRDKQLPFKSIDPVSVQLVAAPVTKTVVNENTFCFISSKKLFCFKNDHLPQPTVGVLFRPPKA